MAIPTAYALSRARRGPPTLPFGWAAVTVLLVGAVLLIVGIVVLLWAFFGFISGVVGNATSGSFSVGSFFGSFAGMIILLVVGGVLAGVGGWLLHLWWIFLLVDVATGDSRGGNTVRDREAMRADVRVRCRTCARLNPEEARFCLSCGQPV